MTWQPRLVALDVDGCLLEWVVGTDKSEETISPAVAGTVRRVVAADVPIVLASGRSPLGLAVVADMLGLPRPSWMVGSNGAVVCRYPPLEVMHATTFDAQAAVAGVLERMPDAMVASRSRGSSTA